MPAPSLIVLWVVTLLAWGSTIFFAVFWAFRPTAEALQSGEGRVSDLAAPSEPNSTGGQADPDFDLIKPMPLSTKPALPETINVQWDIRSRLLPPVNQGRCNSCWAHALSNTLADQVGLLGQEQPVYLKVQDLFCASVGAQVPGTPMCLTAGGRLTVAIQYVASKGLVRNTDTTTQQMLRDPASGDCQSSDDVRVFVNEGSVRSISVAAPGTDRAHDQIRTIKEFLATRGPCCVTLRIGQDFCNSALRYASLNQTYEMNPASPSAGFHTVELVGYYHPRANDAIDAHYYDGAYWILKNSYGTAWGYQGYFSVAMGQNKYEVESHVYLFTPRIFRDNDQVAFRNAPVYLQVLADEATYNWYLLEAVAMGAMGVVLVLLVFGFWWSRALDVPLPQDLGEPLLRNSSVVSTM